VSKFIPFIEEIELLRQIPNILSVSRIGLSLFSFVLVITREMWLEAFVILVIALMTDLFDGWLARKFHWETEIGKKLDRIGDTVFFPIILIAVALTHPIFFWPTVILLISAAIGKIIRKSARTSRKVRFILHITITGGYVILSVLATVIYAYEAFSLNSGPTWPIILFWLVVALGCVLALYINLGRVQIWLKDGQKILDDG